MAVREEQDRRVGGLPEKLLSLQEAARRLDLGIPEMEELIRQGRIPSFRLGGNLIRIRLSDLEAHRGQEKSPQRFEVSRSSGFAVSRVSLWERVADFLYFNDFYLIVFLILLTLLAIILNL